MKESKFHGTADCLCLATGRRRVVGRLGMPHSGEVLSLETAVWPLDSIGGEEKQQLEEENTRLREVVAELTLDKEMWQEVIRSELSRLLGP
jgi:hypothetical protein